MKKQSDHIYAIIAHNKSLQTVNAGWMTFSINVVSGLKSDKDKCWGTCDFDTYQISLEKKMEDRMARETLFHEICHIFLELCGLGEPEEESSNCISTTNEKLTVTMTRAMLLFTNLNPKLSKELLYV